MSDSTSIGKQLIARYHEVKKQARGQAIAISNLELKLSTEQWDAMSNVYKDTVFSGVGRLGITAFGGILVTFVPNCTDSGLYYGNERIGEPFTCKANKDRD